MITWTMELTIVFVELYKIEPVVNRRATGMEIYKRFLDPKSETALSLDGTKHEVKYLKISIYHMYMVLMIVFIGDQV